MALPPLRELNCGRFALPSAMFALSAEYQDGSVILSNEYLLNRFFVQKRLMNENTYPRMYSTP